jgi:restriction endonuclease S subunit
LFDLDGDYIFASFLLGLRPHDNIDSRFLWVLLNQYRIEGKYMQFMRQNVNGLFNREELQEVTIPVPTIEIQREIVSAIEEEMNIIEYNKRLIEIFEKKIQIKLSEVWGE